MAKSLKDVVIVAACRTAIGSFGGSLKDVRCHVLASTVMKEIVRRSKIDPAIIDDVRFGCCFPDIDAINVARVGLLHAGFPVSIPGVTINRVCTSAMECVNSAAQQISIGYSDVILAGGAENMSYQPYLLPSVRWGTRLQDGPCVDRMIRGLHVGSHFIPYPIDGPNMQNRGKPYIMGMTAEFLAQKHSISRQEQDEVAVRSHNNVERSTKDGTFKEEIVAVEMKKKKKAIIFDKDEHFRPGLTLQALKDLPSGFIPKVGTVTAGNASGINDGASAILLMSRKKANELGLKPMARIGATGASGCAPEVMGESPVPAIANLLQKNGRKISDYGRIEINEAFAAQYLACEKQLGFKREVANVNGSGIGLGHPVGSTGARLIVSLMYEMIRSGSGLGLASICGGGGVSLATEVLLE